MARWSPKPSGRRRRAWAQLIAVSLFAAVIFTSILSSPPDPRRLLFAITQPGETHDHAPSLLEVSRQQQEDYCEYLQAYQELYPPMHNDSLAVEVNAQVQGTGWMASWHMFVLADHDIVSHEIKSRGSWEHNEVMAMIDKMREYRDTPEGQASGQNGTFIDIGGNIGFHTLAAAAAGFDVITFEPMVSNQIVLRQSLCNSQELMDRVTLVAGALSNQSRSDCLLVSPANNRGNGVLSCGDVKYVEAMHGGALQRSVRAVRQYALDDVLADVDDIAMIKMDVEGHEGIVIEGGHTTFHRAPYVCMELSPQLQWAKAETPEQEPPATLEWLTGEGGFDIQGRNEGAWGGAPLSPEELQAMGDIGKGTLASQAIEGPQSQLFLSKRPTPEGAQ